MKRKKSKREESQELAEAVDHFLRQGGEVEHVPRGTSGNTKNSNFFQNKTALEPRSDRTPLTEVVKTLEQRKQKSKPQSSPKAKQNRAKKKLIVDDFGDPVRWTWDES